MEIDIVLFLSIFRVVVILFYITLFQETSVEKLLSQREVILKLSNHERVFVIELLPSFAFHFYFILFQLLLDQAFITIILFAIDVVLDLPRQSSKLILNTKVC